MPELMALEQYLEFLKQDNLQNVTVEADFELIINSVRGFSFIYGDYVLSFNHVRRTTKKLADILASQGVLSTKSRVVLSWSEMPLNRLKMHCHD